MAAKKMSPVQQVPEWKAWAGEGEEWSVRVRAHTHLEAHLMACEHFGEWEPESVRAIPVTPEMRLAEAAPELLEACERLSAFLTYRFEEPTPAMAEELRAARAAIAKARGEAP